MLFSEYLCFSPTTTNRAILDSWLHIRNERERDYRSWPTLTVLKLHTLRTEKEEKQPECKCRTAATKNQTLYLRNFDRSSVSSRFKFQNNVAWRTVKLTKKNLCSCLTHHTELYVLSRVIFLLAWKFFVLGLRVVEPSGPQILLLYMQQGCVSLLLVMSLYS